MGSHIYFDNIKARRYKKNMKWFHNLMKTNRRRLLWLLLLLIITLLFPIIEDVYLVITVVLMILAYIPIMYLSDKLDLRHKRLWKLGSILFFVLAYILFLIIKRKELSKI